MGNMQTSNAGIRRKREKNPSKIRDAGTGRKMKTLYLVEYAIVGAKEVRCNTLNQHRGREGVAWRGKTEKRGRMDKA